jgi:hypothetical protein
MAFVVACQRMSPRYVDDDIIGEDTEKCGDVTPPEGLVAAQYQILIGMSHSCLPLVWLLAWWSEDTLGRLGAPIGLGTLD